MILLVYLLNIVVHFCIKYLIFLQKFVFSCFQFKNFAIIVNFPF